MKILIFAIGVFLKTHACLAKDEEVTSIKNFNSISQKGIYNLVGYISKIYECHCPPPAQCKPCMGDNFVLSFSQKKIQGYNELTNEDLIVYFSTIDQKKQKLEIGNHIKMRIQKLPNPQTPYKVLKLQKLEN